MFVNTYRKVLDIMKRVKNKITASQNMSAKGIVPTLVGEVGSRLDPKECYAMNSGDGSTFILFDDPDVGDLQLFELEITSGDCVAVGYDEINNAVLTSWGK